MIPAAVKPQRAVAIDYFKSYLVIGMVLAHTVALLYHDTNNLTGKLLHALVVLINLISFSGFFFCFGFVNYKVYITRTWPEVKIKLAQNALRILAAYYLSAFSAAILLSNFKLENDRFLRILFFTEMPAYSEFLLAFFLVTAFTLVLFKALKRAVEVPWIMWTIIAISILSTVFIPYQLIHNNQAGLLIGGRNFIGFPVLQYLCYFLAGIMFAKNNLKVGPKMLLLSLLISLPFFLSILVNHHLPTRFPPGILWVTGPAFLLCVYYAFSLKSESWFGRANRILPIGHQTLLYLILSNIFIFALAAKFRDNLLTNAGTVCLGYVLIMASIYYLSKQATR